MYESLLSLSLSLSTFTTTSVPIANRENFFGQNLSGQIYPDLLSLFLLLLHFTTGGSASAA